VYCKTVSQITIHFFCQQLDKKVVKAFRKAEAQYNYTERTEVKKQETRVTGYHTSALLAAYQWPERY